MVNGNTVTVPTSPNNTVAGLSEAINNAAITGVYSAHIGGQLQIYADGTANSGAGTVSIANGTGTPLATLGLSLIHI